MLEFWFDPKISILRKLAIFIVIALITGTVFYIQALPLDAILMFVGTGIIFLISRYCKLYFFSQNPNARLARICTWIPIAILLALLFAKAQQELLILGVQGIGFMALASCIFSPLSLLNKNTPPQAPKQ